MTEKNKMDLIKVDGTAYYPHLVTPSDLSGKYQITVGQLDKDTVAALKAKGVKVNQDRWTEEELAEGKVDRGMWITPKDVPTRNAPSVVDTTNKAFDASKIGNGSKVRVLINVYPSSFGGKALGLKKVMVTELVEYHGGNGGDYSDYDMGEADGFVAEADQVADVDMSDNAPFDV